MNLTTILPHLHRLLTTVRHHRHLWYPIAIGSVFVIGTLSLILGFFLPKNATASTTANQCSSQPPTAQKPPLKQTPTTEIRVDIAGAINHPGVYTMDGGARVDELVLIAGGFHKKVSTQYVAKELNLSHKLSDEEKIYVPYVGESTNMRSAASPSNTTAAKSSVVHVNSDSKQQLESLIGVGSVRAQNIIDNRPFQSIGELVQKGVLTQKILNDNEGKLEL